MESSRRYWQANVVRSKRTPISGLDCRSRSLKPQEILAFKGKAEEEEPVKETKKE